MSVEPREFEIRRAEGELLDPLYRLLGEMFPVDRPMAAALLDGRLTLPNWDMYVMCRGDEIVSHAALAHMRVWRGGGLTPVAGIASVFTRPAWQRKGLARRLLEHGVAIADAAGEPCFLFTDLPRVYEGVGFAVIEQRYRAASVPEAGLGTNGLVPERVPRLEESHIREMGEVYAGRYPDYDGKVERDRAYWSFYRCLYNGRSDVTLTFARDGEGLLGYVRSECTWHALWLTELCCAAADSAVVEALLGSVFEMARRRRQPVVVALPDEHPAWALLARHDLRPWADPREVFMGRLRPGHEHLAGLQWSLADRF